MRQSTANPVLELAARIEARNPQESAWLGRGRGFSSHEGAENALHRGRSMLRLLC